ncbi:uncharacterized protein IAS62_001792 [Cryptococcus decagattii]|uniref:Mitochondrial group I intron splicing factor CCM1 n=1 Tax=Cryptococcus decagattii TaxID=1859122 RepID=A0ABZ2APQ2_9TREE
MLGPRIARKVARIRHARLACRNLHTLDTYPPPSHSLLDESTTQPSPERNFPLYKPQQYAREIPLTADTLAALPSEQALSRQLKQRVTEKATESLPEFTEDELRDFYAALVKSGSKDAGGTYPALGAPSETKKIPMAKKEMEEILTGMARRLVGEGGLALPEGPKRYTILSGPSETSKGKAVEGRLPLRSLEVPLGMVTSKEWDALFQEFIRKGDAASAESLLDIMDAHGVPVDLERINSVIHAYALKGRSEDVARLTLDMTAMGETVSSDQQDNYILSLLRQTPSNPGPAIARLRQAEIAGTPFPQSSYQAVISHLTSPSSIVQPNSHTRAVAWDLFAHMRLAAHPTPTRELYTTMIKSCGEANQPEPERARDLWIEMTEQEKIEPSTEAYNAIIKSLGSTKKDYLEAFDLLRQMLVKHNDAVFVPFEEDDGIPRFSEYVPTLETFASVLEGTKRAGDVNRARWVLSEVVKLSRAGQALNVPNWKEGPSGELMASVFMTYVAWNPVLRKKEVKMRKASLEGASEKFIIEKEEHRLPKDEEFLNVDVLQDVAESSAESSSIDYTFEELPVNDYFTPLSSADAIRECTSLFHRILSDIQSSSSTSDFLPFRHVYITTKLINSYISVYNAHGPSLSSVKQVYDTVWEEASHASGHSVKPNGWTFIPLLEKCASGSRGGIYPADRSLALSWGRTLWSTYLLFSKSASFKLASIPSSEHLTIQRRKYLLGLGDRQTERIWKAAIKLEALHGDTDQALKLLEEFHTTYKPDAITESYAPLPEMGLRLKMFTPAMTPEADVPPLLFFDDIKPLHQRLVREARAKDIKKVKWIVAGYEQSLKTRRGWRMKGVGQMREKSKVKDLERLLAQLSEMERLE